jgi:hypothetical protein
VEAVSAGPIRPHVEVEGPLGPGARITIRCAADSELLGLEPPSLFSGYTFTVNGDQWRATVETLFQHGDYVMLELRVTGRYQEG